MATTSETKDTQSTGGSTTNGGSQTSQGGTTTSQNGGTTPNGSTTPAGDGGGSEGIYLPDSRKQPDGFVPQPDTLQPDTIETDTTITDTSDEDTNVTDTVEDTGPTARRLTLLVGPEAAREALTSMLSAFRAAARRP